MSGDPIGDRLQETDFLHQESLRCAHALEESPQKQPKAAPPCNLLRIVFVILCSVAWEGLLFYLVEAHHPA